MQRIYIRHNGPVKEFEMEVEKFNLLIGQQATGKSTIAKSVYFFRTIKTKLTDYFTQIYDTNSYNNIPQHNVWFYEAVKTELKNMFVKLFGYSWDLSPQFYMKYDYAPGIWIEVSLKKNKPQKNRTKQFISLTYSTDLIRLLKELQQEVRELHFNNKQSSRTSLALANEERKRSHEQIAHKVNSIFCDNKETYYIPAGRSLLTVMSDNRAAMNTAGNLDLATETFMMLIDSVRNSFKQGVRQAHLFYPAEKRAFDIKRIADMMISIEKGEYFYSNGKEFLKLSQDPEHPVSINFASSGQQEVLWLLNFIYILLLREENAFLIIEEPEAHIYPLLQKQLMEFIVNFSNIQDSGIFIATHSPYILTVSNNLYYAGVLAEEGQSKKVHKLINKNYTIKKNTLSAYKLLPVSDCPSQKSYIRLLDEDERELRPYLIDDVSSQVNELYTALYDIELDKEQE